LDLPVHTRFNHGWFAQHYHDFPFFGGSIDNFVQSIMTAQIETTFGQNNNNTISDETLQRGFDDYMRFVVEPLRQEKERYEAEQLEAEHGRFASSSHQNSPVLTGLAGVPGFGIPFLRGAVNCGPSYGVGMMQPQTSARVHRGQTPAWTPQHFGGAEDATSSSSDDLPPMTDD
jgi:hypothetical protein